MKICVLLLGAMLAMPNSGRYIGCRNVSVTALNYNQISPLGFSAADMLSDVIGKHLLEVHYSDGKETVGKLVVTYQGGAIKYLVRKFDDGGTGQEIAMPCDDYLETEVAISLITQDGKFNEQLHAKLLSSDGKLVKQEIKLDVDNLGGNYSTPDFIKKGWGKPGLIIEPIFDAGIIRGDIYLLVEKQIHGKGKNLSAQLNKIAVAGFKKARENQGK